MKQSVNGWMIAGNSVKDRQGNQISPMKLTTKLDYKAGDQRIKKPGDQSSRKTKAKSKNKKA
jgi:hypothetical protein